MEGSKEVELIINATNEDIEEYFELKNLLIHYPWKSNLILECMKDILIKYSL